MPCKNHPFVEEQLTRCSRCGESFCPDCVVAIGGYPYCAACKVESLRDLRSGVPTHQLELASIGKRFLALIIDNLLLSIPIVILFIAAAIPLGLFSSESAPEAAAGAMLLLQGVFTLLILGGGICYEGFMLANGGQTVGKKVLKIKVVTPEGNDISRGQAWGRAAMRQVISVFCCAFLDYLFAFGEEKACIHDHVAKTRVVDWNA